MNKLNNQRKIAHLAPKRESDENWFNDWKHAQEEALRRSGTTENESELNQIIIITWPMIRTSPSVIVLVTLFLTVTLLVQSKDLWQERGEGETAYENKRYTHQIEIRIKLLKETFIHSKTEVVMLICTYKLQSGFHKRLRNATSIWPTLACENSHFCSSAARDVSRETFFPAKRPQRRGARRNGCFRRLGRRKPKSKRSLNIVNSVGNRYSTGKYYLSERRIKSRKEINPVCMQAQRLTHCDLRIIQAMGW